MKSTWIEIKKFITYNWKRILLWSLLIGVILTVIIFWRNRSSSTITQEVTYTNDNNEEVVINEDAAPVAYFQYYVEREDGVSFTNTSLINYYFKQEEVLKDLSESTGIPLNEIIISEEDVDPETEVNIEEFPYIMFDVVKDEYSHVHTFIAGTNNSENNLEIATYFNNMLKNDEIPFYSDKDVYFTTDPKLTDIQDELNESAVNTAQSLPESSNTTMSIILQSMAGLVLAVVVVTGIQVIKSLFSDKLIYSFSYLWDEKDLFFLNDDDLNNKEELEYFITYPLSDGKVVVNEQGNVPFDNNQINVDFFTSIADIPLDKNIKEVIIIVNEGKTTRDWYKQQQTLLAYRKNNIVKIIQFNR